MHIIAMLLIGLVAGALAKLILPGSHGHSIALTMLLGVAGSIIAGFVGRSLGYYHAGVDGPGLIMSTVGAMVVLAVYHFAVNRRTSNTLTPTTRY